MTYLISKSFDEQRENRVRFIQKVIGLPMFLYRREIFEDFYLYQSFPFNTESEICLVFGHNKEVANLLKNHMHKISEKNIFIISCSIDYLTYYNVPNKKIFLCPQTGDGYVGFRNGLEFHLDFIVTDTELFLAQSEENDILQKLESCFELIYDNTET